MKREKSNYHAPHVLKTAEPRLRKAIDSNCKKELEKTISECVLNALNGNIKLTGCSKPNLRKHKAALRKVADKRVSLSSKKKFIVQNGGFLLPLLSAVLPTIASLISDRLIKTCVKIMLRKMYLVSADRFKQPSIFPISAAQPKAPSVRRRSRRRRRRRDKNKRNVNTPTKIGLSTVK